MFLSMQTFQLCIKVIHCEDQNLRLKVYISALDTVVFIYSCIVNQFYKWRVRK